MSERTRDRDEDRLVTVGEYFTPIEAEWARSVLASAGLCSMLPDQVMGFMLEGTTGAIRLQVPASREEEARALLNEMDFERGLFLEAHARGEADASEPGPPQEPSDDGTAIDPHEPLPHPPRYPLPLLCRPGGGPLPRPRLLHRQRRRGLLQAHPGPWLGEVRQLRTRVGKVGRAGGT